MARERRPRASCQARGVLERRARARHAPCEVVDARRSDDAALAPQLRRPHRPRPALADDPEGGGAQRRAVRVDPRRVLGGIPGRKPGVGVRPRSIRSADGPRAGRGPLDGRVRVARACLDGGDLRARPRRAGLRRGGDVSGGSPDRDPDSAARSARPGPGPRLQRRIARGGLDADHRHAGRAAVGLARRVPRYRAPRHRVARPVGPGLARRAAEGVSERRPLELAAAPAPDGSVGVGLHGRLRVRRAAARLRAVRRADLSRAAPGLGPGDARARPLGPAARLGGRATSSGDGSSTAPRTTAAPATSTAPPTTVGPRTGRSSGASSRSSPRSPCRSR